MTNVPSCVFCAGEGASVKPSFPSLKPSERSATNHSEISNLSDGDAVAMGRVADQSCFPRLAARSGSLRTQGGVRDPKFTACLRSAVDCLGAPGRAPLPETSLETKPESLLDSIANRVWLGAAHCKSERRLYGPVMVFGGGSGVPTSRLSAVAHPRCHTDRQMVWRFIGGAGCEASRNVTEITRDTKISHRSVNSKPGALPRRMTPEDKVAGLDKKRPYLLQRKRDCGRKGAEKVSPLRVT
jgi:hypothetical protein